MTTSDEEVDGIDEGSNVTLLCSAYPTFLQEPNWSYGDKLMGKLQDIDEQRPPKGT